MILRNVLLTLKEDLSVSKIENPWFEACLLAAHVLKRDRAWVLSALELDLETNVVDQLFQLARRRCGGEPMAYIRGRREFWKHDFMVGPGVLIPRPETEILLEWVLEDHGTNERLLCRDLCTGSACIPLSLALECPSWSWEASDISPEALSWGEKNLRALSPPPESPRGRTIHREPPGRIRQSPSKKV